MASLKGNNEMEKLKSLNAKTYTEQACWFLNFQWKTLFAKDQAARLKVWNYTQLMIQLDKKGKAGNELNEFDAHRFLEKNEETLSVRDMREMLKKIDIDFNKSVSLSEYFVCKYNVDWKKLVSATMGSNTDELEKAQAMVDAAQVSLGVALANKEKSEKAEKEQKIAEAELKRALKQLEDEETAFKTLLNKLETESNDVTKGAVTRGRAKNELEQLKSKDPLPLSRAKINQAAAVRKAERASLAAKEALEQAEKTKEEAEKAFNDAKAYLDKVANNCGSAEGTVWWMQNELEEAKKFLPQSKGGVARIKVAGSEEKKE